MLLSPEERQRFVDYCKCEAESYLGIVEQLKKLNVPMAVVRGEEQLFKSYLIVAEHLSRVEDDEPKTRTA